MNSLYKQLNPQPQPTIQDILREVQENGGDAKSLVIQKCKERGLDLDNILDQARQLQKIFGK